MSARRLKAVGLEDCMAPTATVWPAMGQYAWGCRRYWCGAAAVQCVARSTDASLWMRGSAGDSVGRQGSGGVDGTGGRGAGRSCVGGGNASVRSSGGRGVERRVGVACGGSGIGIATVSSAKSSSRKGWAAARPRMWKELQRACPAQGGLEARESLRAGGVDTGVMYGVLADVCEGEWREGLGECRKTRRVRPLKVV